MELKSTAIEKITANQSESHSEQDDEFDHGFFKSWGGKNPPQVNCVMGLQERSCSWSMLIGGILYDHTHIVAPFINTTLLIVGKGLDELHDYMVRQKVACIREAVNPKPTDRSYVERIAFHPPVEKIDSLDEYLASLRNRE